MTCGLLDLDAYLIIGYLVGLTTLDVCPGQQFPQPEQANKIQRPGLSPTLHEPHHQYSKSALIYLFAASAFTVLGALVPSQKEGNSM